jgi:hypothetical protein
MHRIARRGPLAYVGWGLLFVALTIVATALFVGEVAAIGYSSLTAAIAAALARKNPRAV